MKKRKKSYESNKFDENSTNKIIIQRTKNHELIFNDPDRLKPALLRAVNWIFGGCPEASRKAALKRNKIEKEENQETDEWFL